MEKRDTCVRGVSTCLLHGGHRLWYARMHGNACICSVHRYMYAYEHMHGAQGPCVGADFQE